MDSSKQGMTGLPKIVLMRARIGNQNISGEDMGGGEGD